MMACRNLDLIWNTKEQIYPYFPVSVKVSPPGFNYIGFTQLYALWV